MEDNSITFGDAVEVKTLAELLGDYQQKEIDPDRSFYLIWAQGSTPKIQHATEEEATRVARKAAQAQQKEIFVLKAVSKVVPRFESDVKDLR